MFSFIKTWWMNRKAAIYKEKWQQGYDWAMNQLRFGLTVDDIDCHINNPFNCCNNHPFDKGAMQACHDYIRDM